MTIKELADLLIQTIKTECDSYLEYSELVHGPSIGELYEALTADVLQKSLPNEVYVSTHSFIEGSNTEFDVIVSYIEDKRYGRTERYIYKPQDVVAVFQIKKNLKGNELADAYDNLDNLRDCYYDMEIPDERIPHLNSTYSLFTGGKSEDEAMMPNEYAIYRSLKLEEILPIRIILGFISFANEDNLRRSFAEFVENNFSKGLMDFSPALLPNLIIGG